MTTYVLFLFLTGGIAPNIPTAVTTFEFYEESECKAAAKTLEAQILGAKGVCIRNKESY